MVSLVQGCQRRLTWFGAEGKTHASATVSKSSTLVREMNGGKSTVLPDWGSSPSWGEWQTNQKCEELPVHLLLMDKVCVCAGETWETTAKSQSQGKLENWMNFGMCSSTHIQITWQRIGDLRVQVFEHNFSQPLASHSDMHTKGQLPGSQAYNIKTRIKHKNKN